MTLTQGRHARSTRTALAGLALQLVAFVAVLVLSNLSSTIDQPLGEIERQAPPEYTWTLLNIAWLLLAGVIPWFVTALVFRQRHLSELESIDIELLKREKQLAEGGALFDPDAEGFRVAAGRLAWLERWMIPAFSLASATYLLGIAGYQWFSMTSAGLTLGRSELELMAWGGFDATAIPLSMVILGTLVLLTFLFSRYAAGMAGGEGWELLRGCASLQLLQSVAMTVMIVALGIREYAGGIYVEHVLGYAIPVVMAVLGAESLLYFIADVYRPRVRGVTPRAAFDSRLLGLFSEPGGVAASIREAINYQFGFQVSQTWFYRMVERAATPMILVGGLIFWTTTGIVIVGPTQHAVVERFGRQINVDDPLGPGIHFKRPYPFESVATYETGRLHELHIGFQDADAEAIDDPNDTKAVQWTDQQHFGHDHWKVLIPTPSELSTAQRDRAGGMVGSTALVTDDRASLPALGATEDEQRVPANLIQLDVVLQYRVDATKLRDFTLASGNPVELLREFAWDEVSRFCASHDVFELLEATLHRDSGADDEPVHIGTVLRERIQQRIEDARLGLKLEYVGLLNVHPQQQVAEAFREVVNAQAEKRATIQRARVEESRSLTEVAGSTRAATALAFAVEVRQRRNEQLNAAREAIARLDVQQETAVELRAALTELDGLIVRAEESQATVDTMRDGLRRLEVDAPRDLAGVARDYDELNERLIVAERDAREASAALAAGVTAVRDMFSERVSYEVFDVIADEAVASRGRDYWSRRLQGLLPNIQGAAAETIAAAQAERWQIEMSEASRLVQLRNQESAFRAAPETFLTRQRIEALTEASMNPRKYILAVPDSWPVKIRVEAQEQAQVGLPGLGGG